MTVDAFTDVYAEERANLRPFSSMLAVGSLVFVGLLGNFLDSPAINSVRGKAFAGAAMLMLGLSIYSALFVHRSKPFFAKSRKKRWEREGNPCDRPPVTDPSNRLFWQVTTLTICVMSVFGEFLTK